MNAVQAPSRLIRETKPGQHVFQLQREDYTEWFITSMALPNENPQGMCNRLQACLAAANSPGTIQTDIVGDVNTAGTALWQQKYCFDCTNCTLNHAEGAPMTCPIGGMFVHAIDGLPLKPVWLGGEVVGFCYEDAYAKYVQINNLYPDPIGTREAQLQQLFDRMEAALATEGMVFTDVIRTWFYLEQILEWYDEFNVMRDEFFKKHGVYDNFVPVSTGIGGHNANGAAGVADMLAVVPKNNQIQINALPSPLQCPALDYGSSFSRALEIVVPDHRRILVSGTASIHPEGETAHVDDMDGQVDLTMRVVEAILAQRDMGWSDVVRGIAYVKNTEDFGALDKYCQAHNIHDFPVPVVRNDVCRDDLLFEIEVDAVKPL